MMLRRFAYLALVSFVLVAHGCSIKTPPKVVIDKTPRFEPLKDQEAEILAAHLSTRLQDLESWSALKPGLEDSLNYIVRRPQNAICVKRPGLTLTWGQLGDSVAEMIGLLPDLDRDPRLVAERFQWLKVAPGTLLTGYYEPWLEASLVPDDTYKYPLYGVPDDLKTIHLNAFHPRWKGQSLVYRMGEDGIEPYYDRESIDGDGALHGKGHEIAWTKSPVDIFFLQIQGSGRLQMDDGSTRHILYAGKNGRRFVAIGKYLINGGHVAREDMSMQKIRAFLKANPTTAQELMFKDPSYVFFSLADEGPYGAMSTILTPRVSAAVDRTMIPLGSVLALKTAFMDYEKGETDPFMSLVLAQDTGGAIKNTRMDLFCGTGEGAEDLAGHLLEDSEVFMLVSKRVMKAISGD